MQSVVNFVGVVIALSFPSLSWSQVLPHLFAFRFMLPMPDINAKLSIRCLAVSLPLPFQLALVDVRAHTKLLLVGVCY